AGHGGFVGYHFVVLLLGCFPASILALRSFFYSAQPTTSARNFRTWMKILFWVVIILFSLVQSKIVHYSSLAYFPITYLATLRIYQVITTEAKVLRYEKILLFTLGTLYGIIVTLLPIVGQHIHWLVPLLQKDPFALANLEAEVSWHIYQGIGGWLLLISTAIGCYFLQKARYLEGFRTIMIGSAWFVIVTLYSVINNIEGYSQRAAIDFYKKMPADALVIPYGYKSYAHLFYTDKTPTQAALTTDKNALLEQASQRTQPVYVVTKITRTQEFERHYPHFRQIEARNGFVFYIKE
ncbi:MAG: glycosyl transferase, partial [Bacteroidota bacterium]